LKKAVEKEADNAIKWYWRAKLWKRVFSRWIQFMALALAAAAGIVPIVIQLSGAKWDSGLLASLLVGLAAAVLGMDKAFGFSSGWTRYVLTATTMTKQLHDFRMDWISLMATADPTPTTTQQSAMIQRAKDFIAAIQAMILQETKDWATDFQNNMAQMEKDIKNQLDALKAQVEKAEQDRKDAEKPGAIELTVTNADKTDGYKFDVSMDGKGGKAKAPVSNSKVWAKTDVNPGQYVVEVTAASKGVVVNDRKVAHVRPGETEKVSITLSLQP